MTSTTIRLTKVSLTSKEEFTFVMLAMESDTCNVVGNDDAEV
jgi:hypothetical protein